MLEGFPRARIPKAPGNVPGACLRRFMNQWDEQNPFAALLSVLTVSELGQIRDRLMEAGCPRTAEILADEIAERHLGVLVQRGK
jgi:hypothetical protein